MNNFGTVNKAVSLFLVGGLLLLLTLGFFWFELLDKAHHEQIVKLMQNAAPGFTAFGTLVFVALSAVFGVGAQGLSGMIIRNPFQRLVSRRMFVTLLGQPALGREVLRWREHFRTQAEADPLYSNFLESKKEAGRRRHNFPMLATALFYRTSRSPHLEWVLQHYSTYYLATDVTMVLISALPWAAYQAVRSQFDLLWSCVVIGLMILIHSCLCLALHRYLYTTGALLRHGSLVLASRAGQASEDEVE